MRKKFKILYPEDHNDVTKRGKPCLFGPNRQVVMSSSGVFLLVDKSDPYMVSCTTLRELLPKYDVVWKK